ncbi:MAG: hypothetical protein WDZ76_08660 [Pseudohongiellaceae bacterium]
MPGKAVRGKIILPVSSMWFAALGDRTRLSLVEKLAGDSPQSIAQLTAGSNLISSIDKIEKGATRSPILPPPNGSNLDLPKLDFTLYTSSL